jgi:prevent-host-death family protein
MAQLVYDVGVRALQQRLSHVLDLAASGHVIRITSRGRPKALILPPAAERWLSMLANQVWVDSRAEQGTREGWLRPPTIDERPDIPERGFDGRTSVATALRQDRDE